MSSSRIYGSNIVSSHAGAVPRGRALPRKAVSVTAIEAVMLKAALFIAVAGGTYMVCSLAGNMKTEQARQMTNLYSARARTAEASMGDLKSTAQNLTSGAAIQQWADQNKFALLGLNLTAEAKAGSHPSSL